VNKEYILFWIFIVLGTFLESVGDVAFRYATIHHKEFYRYTGYIIYILGSASWAISLKYHELTKGLIVFIALNVLMVAVASRYMFAEHLNANQMIGILFVLAGIFFVEG
jgi:multidrug transporter EmrE-like cation transporter